MLTELLKQVHVEPRPYQQRIVTKALQMFAGSFRNRAGQMDPAVHNVLIESPTGSGKTVMGLLTAKWMQQQHGLRVGWVAMRRNLLTQVMAENIRKGFNVDLQPISMFDKQPPQVDMLVIDEAQHDAAMSMSALHEQVQPKFVLGLSATPYRSDRVQLCFEKSITDAGIHQLIQDGYLSPYHHYTIQNYTPETVAECFLREPERWGKTLIFFHRHEQCVACAALLAAAGVRTAVVTASSNRELQLAAFEAGKVDVLLNVAILTEGFDCPTLKTVFCRPSGKGCTIQMGGRAFRKHPDVPIKQIVQCQQTEHPFAKTATPAEQYVWMGDGWRTLKINRYLETLSRRSLQVIAASDVSLPPLLLAHREPRRDPWRRFTPGERS